MTTTAIVGPSLTPAPTWRRLLALFVIVVAISAAFVVGRITVGNAHPATVPSVTAAVPAAQTATGGTDVRCRRAC